MPTGDYQSPPGAWKTKVCKKPKNAIPSKRNRGFPGSVCLKPTPPRSASSSVKGEPELILGGSVEGLFFKHFFPLLFFGFLVLWVGFGTPWGGSKSVKIAKSWLREAFFEWILLVLGFGLKNHRFFILLASKSVAFLVVFFSCFGGTFASILACLAMSEDAYYTVKTNEKSTFFRFCFFHAFVKRCAFRVGFAYIFKSEIHAFLEGANWPWSGWFFINFHALEATLGSRNLLGGLSGGIPKNHQISILHF